MKISNLQFALFMKLRECRFLYFFSLCDIRNEAVFLILEHFSLTVVKQKKQKKKNEILAFKPLFTRDPIENMTIRKIF